MAITNRLGEERYNNFGSKMIICRYSKSKDIDIYFPNYNWVAKNRRYEDFVRGKVKCPYEPRIYGKGYIGEGEYKSYENGKLSRCYRTWEHMLQRCYDNKYKEKYPTYKECICDESWLNFQNFAKWYSDNYYTVGDELMSLDKDILVKNNKIYGSDTCIFTPKSINSLFVKNDKNRSEHGIGAIYRKRDKKFESWCNDKCLGRYDTQQEAFQAYKKFKENYIKQVADEYKEYIPQKLYEAMYNYKVEIGD